MKLIIKILVIFLILTVGTVLIYYFFGDQADLFLSREKCIAWFSGQKRFAWMAGILLLVSDIVLPIPATGVMAAIGNVYGVWNGTVINSVGSAIAGITGYLVARFIGRQGIRYIATEPELERFKNFFDDWGGYAVIISRIMPVMPEVITILAGFSKMKFSRFLAALFAGTVPVSFFFSLVGANSVFDTGTGIIIAILIPVMIWPVFLKMSKV